MIRTLSDDLVRQVIEEAVGILADIGFFLENAEARDLLRDSGARIDDSLSRVYLKPETVHRAVESAPAIVSLYDREGQMAAELGGTSVCFDPGSAALNVLDPATGAVRPARTPDYVSFTQVVDRLPHIHAQSTAMICSDVPRTVADRYRLYLALLYSRKPVVTGTFLKPSFAPMREMLVTVRGSAEELRRKPLAVFDACPSPPLKWSDLTCQSVIDAARAGIPSELVSMPLTGANAPVTLLGAVVQHAAETLAGVVISQAAAEGAPVIWGGSPAAFDMSKATTPMGSIDTMLIDLAYAEVGQKLGLPTHTYLGMSDAKVLDMQTGMESGMGTLLAGLKGINMISGAGMLNFESTQSIQKLVIDNEICGMTYKLLAGISRRDDPMARDLIPDLLAEKHLLTHEHTLRWFKEEHYFPSAVIDRANFEEWAAGGRKNAGDRAWEIARDLIASHPGIDLDPRIARSLTDRMRRDALEHGLNELPATPRGPR